jgi:hypothetical protein
MPEADGILDGVEQYALREPHRIAIGNTLARLMAGEGGDPVRTAEQISKLTAILADTMPSDPAADPIDVSALSDDDLATLERIAASCPRAPAKPEMAAAMELIEKLSAENTRVRAEREQLRADADYFRAEHSRLAHELDHARLDARGGAGEAAGADRRADAGAIKTADEAIDALAEQHRARHPGITHAQCVEYVITATEEGKRF